MQYVFKQENIVFEGKINMLMHDYEKSLLRDISREWATKSKASSLPMVCNTNGQNTSSRIIKVQEKLCHGFCIRPKRTFGQSAAAERRRRDAGGGSWFSTRTNLYQTSAVN